MMMIALLLAVQDWESLTTADAWKSPSPGWEFKDGEIHRAAKAGDLYTKKTWLDFELEFEWKIAPGGNSGVKYRMKGVGPEYQVIDDAKHADAKNAIRSTASLYDVKAPAADKPLKAPGEWNQSRVVAKGKRLEHWLNGAKVMDIEIDGAEWPEAFAKSKFAKTKGADQWWGRESGPVMLQDHGDEVWFRAIRIKELK